MGDGKGYFSEVAGQWDELRSGFFTAAMRDAAIARAGLVPGGVLADVGTGTGFVLRGKADRLDVRTDNCIDILDYKTGRTPSIPATAAGFEPQAPLEAAMVRDGAFDGIDPANPGDLLYVQLSGGSTPGAEKPVNRGRGAKTTEELMLDYEDNLRKLIKRYGQEDTPYLSQIFAQFENEWGDYDRLARRAEWSSAEDDQGGQP